MALEEDEAKQLEERFERLENKLRATFLEVEKRFNELGQEPHSMEERMQELEDLILLMQLEITKIKDRTSVTTEFLAPDTPGMAERLSRLEEAVGAKSAEPAQEKADEGEEPLGTAEEEPEAWAHGEQEERTEKEEPEAARPRARGKSLLEEVQEILSS